MATYKVTAGTLAFDVLYNEFHLPLVNGKANRDRIEDAITVGMMQNALGYVDKETVDIAVGLIDDLLVQYGAVNDQVAKRA